MRVTAKKSSKPSQRVARKKTVTRRAIGRPPASDPGVGRQALIEKTCELLRTMPPDQVTRAAVARHAKVDPSLIRYYFKERSALLIAAAEQISNQFASIIAKGTAQSLSPPELLRLRVDTLLNTTLANPFFHRLMVDEIVPSKSAAAKQLLRKVNTRSLDGYTSILAAGEKDGSLRHVEPAFLFLAVIGMCEFFLNGIPILKNVLGDDLDETNLTKRYREFVFDLLLNGLKPTGKT
jgi:TetR/AcrR family transcriptional regulator